MSGQITHRDLADVLASRWHTASDIDRIAERSGLDLGRIERHPRPVDHWSAAIAEAVDNGAVMRLLDAAELADGERQRFARLVDTPKAGSRPAIRLSLVWSDLPGDDTRSWRVEPRGKRCPVTAEVRMFGGERGVRPILRWRHGRLPLRGPWAEAPLQGAAAPQPGFSLWRATVDLEAGDLRTCRLDAIATVEDQQHRESRLVVPERGVYAAGLVFLAVVGFAIGWLWSVPGLTFNLGLGGTAIGLGIATVQAGLVGEGVRGPWWGFGVLERAGVAGLLAALALIILPSQLLVIIDNGTAIDVSVGTHTGETISMGPGRHTLPVWDAPMTTSERAVCVCGASTDPACPCDRQSVRLIPVLHVRCRNTEWQSLAGLSGAVSGAGLLKVANRVWVTTDDRCTPITDATATLDLKALGSNDGQSGEAIMTVPVAAELTAVAFEPGAASSDVAIHGASEERPLFEAHGVKADERLMVPAIEARSRSFRIRLSGGERGLLECATSRPFGTDPVVVRSLGISNVQVRLESSLGSTWTGDGEARACFRTGVIPAATVELTPRSLDVGSVLALPDWLPTASVTVVAPQGRSIRASRCQRNRWGVLDVHRAVPNTTATAVSGDRTWTVEPVPIGDRNLALLCDPPPSAVVIRLRGVPGKWLLTADRLEKHLPPVCMLQGQDYVHVTRADACPGHCRILAMTDVEAIDVNERQHNTCASVCQC